MKHKYLNVLIFYWSAKAFYPKVNISRDGERLF